MTDEAESARRERAEARRARMIITRGRLGDDVDLTPIHGADAVTLAVRVSEAAWTFAGKALPPPRARPVVVELRRRIP